MMIRGGWWRLCTLRFTQALLGAVLAFYTTVLAIASAVALVAMCV